MSATFNWAYRPGVSNKYGFTVPAGADNVRPTGWCYVALFGNDTTGNGSRQYPFRTITKACAVSLTNNTIVLSSGVYREVTLISGAPNTIAIIGDGDVSIDISYNGGLFNNNIPTFCSYNTRWKGNGASFVSAFANAVNNGGPNIWSDCFFEGAGIAPNGGSYVATNCVFENFSAPFNFGNNNDAGTVVTNCTFVNCNNMRFTTPSHPTSKPFTSSIFYNCNLSFTDISYFSSFRYCLFYQCNYKMTPNLASGGALYPACPNGYVYYSSIDSLKAAYFAVYSTSAFNGCLISDPLFNNWLIGDYSLSFNSPAKNLSYFGTYIGAKSIAQVIRIKTNEESGDLDFSTAINVAIVDDSITLIDPAQDGKIETKIILNSLGREIKSIPIIGINADRNGQYIDSISDKSAATYSAGDVLPPIMPFIVESGSITLGGIVYTAGQRGTTASYTSTFTTSTAGVIREILEAPQRHTIEMKLSDTLPFTDEVFNHFEPGIAPTTNNVSDLRIGAILRGNGDPSYVRGGLGVKEFPVNSRYIKIRFTIRHDNLKP